MFFEHRLYSRSRRHSSAVEQLFRKQQVLGSNPSVGSTPQVRAGTSSIVCARSGRACETLAAGDHFGANLGIEGMAPRGDDIPATCAHPVSTEGGMIHRIIGFILGGITIWLILNASTIIGDPHPEVPRGDRHRVGGHRAVPMVDRDLVRPSSQGQARRGDPGRGPEATGGRAIAPGLTRLAEASPRPPLLVLSNSC